MRIAIPTQLNEYIRLRDGEIILKKELPDNLKADFEKFKKEFEVSRAMFKLADEYEPKELTEEEKEFEKYCNLYKEKFGKKAYIAEPSGSKQQTIDAIKTCLEKNEDLLDKLLYPNFDKDMEDGNLY
ncbi:MAG: hypothetical protein J6K23_04615 [Bacilli bacterium]|nr:hypothetical protein [Bacilli bacterium]